MIYICVQIIKIVKRKVLICSEAILKTVLGLELEFVKKSIECKIKR